MEINYTLYTSIPETEIMEGLIQLHKSIFGSADRLVSKIDSRFKLLIIIAMSDTKVVAYKIGYELNLDKFYSWLGGVDQRYRGHGIATHLMKLQHNYLKEHGYKTVQTKTKNKWRDMLILNIKNGFDIIGTYTDEKGEPKIILEKKL